MFTIISRKATTKGKKNAMHAITIDFGVKWFEEVHNAPVFSCLKPSDL